MRAFFAEDPNVYSITDLAAIADSLDDQDDRDIEEEVGAIIKRIDRNMGWDDAEDGDEEDDWDEEGDAPLPAADTIRW